MAEEDRISDLDVRVWTFDEAQGRMSKEYIKSYYHVLDGILAYHTHDFYEINIIYNGTGKHRIEEREIIAQRGDVFIIPPGVRHGYDCKGKMTVYHILLSNAFMTEFAPFFEKLAGYNMLFRIEPMLRSRLERSYSLKSNSISFDSLNRYIALIESGNDGKISNNGTETAFHVLSLIATLSKKMYLLRSTEGAEEDDRVLTLIGSMEYIEDHFAEKLDFCDISSRCAISYSTYLRLFKKLSGITPTEYQMRCRIKRAEELLKNGDETILSVAMFCGFYDSSHFIREFTKSKGISPSCLRRSRSET